MWTDMGAHMGWMWLWWGAGLVVLALLVWAIIRAATPGSLTGPAAELPETILKTRYARGEIGLEEYEKRLAELRK